VSEKTALVTGGSAGIGRSICEHLLDDGYTVINLSRRASENSHDRLVDYPVDLADVDATRAAIDELAGEHRITTVVHNAGVIRPALVEDVDLGDLNYLTNLHLSAGVLLTQATLGTMKEQGFGRIVIIGSRAMLGLETRTSYSATKAAQIGLVRTWAMEHGQCCRTGADRYGHVYRGGSRRQRQGGSNCRRVARKTTGSPRRRCPRGDVPGFAG
jgi:NAD(P)-dependent dehydrogenase (short-subunit alcohol dehydrogenase family)